jgi:Amt family ammonium transporter
LLWSGTVSLLACLLVHAVFGLRVGRDTERDRLDITSHGQNAYEECAARTQAFQLP